MTTYLRPRELARSKRIRTQTVYEAIATGRIRAAAIPTPSGGRRYLILAAEAARWNPPRRQRADKTATLT
jgi:hypothetical protein